MESAFYDFISQYGYIAVAALIFLENVFPPIPSELVLPLSGFFTTTTEMTLPWTIVAATIGSVTGAYVLYAIGRILSRERLMQFFSTKPMRILGFKPEDIETAIGWFDNKGQITVLICRCIPVVRSLISIPAGTAKMNVIRFTLYTLLGSAVWNTILCSLGAAAGAAWETVTEQVSWFSDVVTIIIIVIIAIVIVWWIVKRIIPAARERKESDGSSED